MHCCSCFRHGFTLFTCQESIPRWNSSHSCPWNALGEGELLPRGLGIRVIKGRFRIYDAQNIPKIPVIPSNTLKSHHGHKNITDNTS